MTAWHTECKLASVACGAQTHHEENKAPLVNRATWKGRGLIQALCAVYFTKVASTRTHARQGMMLKPGMC
eukprot:8078737-Alexandrium_andersonii.AAC.1